MVEQDFWKERDFWYSGDYQSEMTKYYLLVVCSIAFASLVVVVTMKNQIFARVYTLERLSVYANELIFAYKAGKEDIMREMNARNDEEQNR